MSDGQVEFLNEYDTWKAERRVALGDLSPEAFLIDRAKEQALAKLIKISDLLEEFFDTKDETHEEWASNMNLVITNILAVVEE